jgi:hypothetical protein
MADIYPSPARQQGGVDFEDRCTRQRPIADAECCLAISGRAFPRLPEGWHEQHRKILPLVAAYASQGHSPQL